MGTESRAQDAKQWLVMRRHRTIFHAPANPFSATVDFAYPGSGIASDFKSCRVRSVRVSGVDGRGDEHRQDHVGWHEPKR